MSTTGITWWSDPFSSHRWSERQSAYARAMNLSGNYTPQIVIGGAGQCVGSYRRNFARRSQPDVQRRPLVAEASALSSAPRSLRYFRSRWTCRLRTAETGPLVLTLAV